MFLFTGAASAVFKTSDFWTGLLLVRAVSGVVSGADVLCGEGFSLKYKRVYEIALMAMMQVSVMSTGFRNFMCPPTSIGCSRGKSVGGLQERVF